MAAHQAPLSPGFSRQEYWSGLSFPSLGEQYGDSLKKPEIKLPYNPQIPLLGIYSEETRTEKYTGTPVFTEALFTTDRTWKQPRCPSADEWIRKLWYIYTGEYDSAVKRNVFESILMRWMNSEPIIESSEVSQNKKDKYHILTHIYGERWYQ